MEKYHRLTKIFLPGSAEIKDDLTVSASINGLIEEFLADSKASGYRIVNCETKFLPSAKRLKSEIYDGYITLIVHLAYKE